MNLRLATGELFPETLSYSILPPPGGPWVKPVRMTQAMREERKRARDIRDTLAHSLAGTQGSLEYKKWKYPNKSKRRHRDKGLRNDCEWTELMQVWTHVHLLTESLAVVYNASGNDLPALPWYRRQDADHHAKRGATPQRHRPPTNEVREIVSVWLWIDDVGSNDPFSFNTCCELRDWEPEWVRKRLEHHRPKNWHETMRGLGLATAQLPK